MELKRKIACSYLNDQYEKAKLYLVSELKFNSNTENIDTICERVRRAGIAYAQTKYCVFMKKGGFGENAITSWSDSNGVTSLSEYKCFIEEMEKYINTSLNTYSN